MVKTPSSSILRKISTPFPDQTPVQMLSRNYLISDFDWVPGLAPVTLNFPQRLFTVPVISQLLQSFAYFRAGVRIQIRMNSTPYHQGSLLISSQPCSDISGFFLVTQSCAKPVVLSASVQDSCTIDIPYLFPQAWITKLTDDPFSIGSIKIAELNRLLTSSVSIPAKVAISIYASFLEPQVAGYVQQPYPMAQSSKEMRFHKKKNKESSEKDQQGTDATNPSVLDKLVSSIPLVGGVVEPILKMATTLGLFDKPTSNQVLQTQQIFPARDHARASGVFVGESISLYQNSNLASDSFDMFSSDSKVTDIARVPSLYANLTYSSSGSLFRLSCTPDVPLFFGQGQDYLTYVTNSFKFWRGSLKFLFHFVSCAFYSARFRISYTTLFQTVFDGDIPSQVIDVKGDTIVELDVPFLWPNYWRSKDDLPTDLTPYLNVELITDITGSAEPSTPVIYLNVWRAAGEDFQVAMPTNATVFPPIKNKITAQTDIRSRFSKTFPSLIDDVKLTTEAGLCMSETTPLVKDLLRRWSNIPPATYASNDLTYVGTFDEILDPTGYYNRELFPYYSSLFLFFKGSRRIRTVNQTGDLILPTTNQTYLSSGGLAFGNNNQTPNHVFNLSVDYEIPYMCEVPYYYVRRTPSASYGLAPLLASPPVGLLANTTAPTTPQFLHIAGGDDFQLLYLTPPAIPTVASSISSVSKIDAVKHPPLKKLKG